MAVRTSPAGGPVVPGWVRSRPGPDPRTLHLTVLEPGAVTAERVRDLWAALADAGASRVVTGALAPADAAPFLAAGFRIAETLDLLARSLDVPPTRTGPRTRRARGLGPVAELDRAAFGDRAFDPAALRDAVDATPRTRVRVCGSPRRPLAYAITGVAGARAYLQRLAVHPDARRRGLGQALVVDGLRWARRRGARRALVNTHTDNAAARRLYEANGFRSLPEGLVVVERAW
jgi:ribosomal protein S18 acetylase RimI-like enzyme